jgi:PKD repeat protein
VADSGSPVSAGATPTVTATTDANTDRAAMWTIELDAAGGSNANPTAAFTSNCTNLNCSFNGSGSSDSDGSITGYAWTFGDSQTGSGVSPSHLYGAAGTYSVTLTVTDNGGGTDSVTHQVSVSSGGAGIAFVAAANAGGGNVKTKTVAIPAAAHAGDTALLFLSQPATMPWSGPTGVTGWTQVGSNFTSGGLTTTVWSKQLTAGNVGANVQFTSASFSHASVNVAVYSGVSGVGTTATAQDANVSSHTTASVNASAGSWVVSMWSDRSTATRTWNTPGSVSQRDASTDSGNLTFQAVVADSGSPVSAGATPTVTATTDANTDRAAMWTIELDAA